jgi:hypothetical protein
VSSMVEKHCQGSVAWLDTHSFVSFIAFSLRAGLAELAEHAVDHRFGLTLVRLRSRPGQYNRLLAQFIINDEKHASRRGAVLEVVAAKRSRSKDEDEIRAYSLFESQPFPTIIVWLARKQVSFFVIYG